jgi:HTH-type transcriptional regulator/antitoxin MqsA
MPVKSPLYDSDFFAWSREQADLLRAGKLTQADIDMDAVDEALRALKEQIEGVPSPATIRRVRAKLKLSQREAGALLKVGENAFDKYERGLVEPSGPTGVLIGILDRHPEIVDELR